jgi:HEPN domain-containing protein
MWFSDLMSDYNLLLEKYYNKNKNTELNSYNAMTNEEKIEFAREVSKFAKDLYRKLVSQIALNSPSAQN